MNRATLIGNVGRDPEFRSTQSGTRVCNFSLATTERWKDRSGERKESTEWHNITVWNEGLIGVIERYVNKGDKLLIEGQIKTRKWQDQSGNDRYSTEIVLSGFDCRLEMLTPKSGGGGSRSSGREERDSYEEPRPGQVRDELDDEIPF